MRTVYIYIYYVICIYTHVGDICKRQITTFGFVQKYGIATTKQMLQKQKLADMSVVNWTFFFCIVFGGDCITQSNGFGPNFPIELATAISQFRTNPYHLFVGYTLHRPLYIKVISQTRQGFGVHPMWDRTSPIGLVKLTPHLEMAMAIVTHFLGLVIFFGLQSGFQESGHVHCLYPKLNWFHVSRRCVHPYLEWFPP